MGTTIITKNGSGAPLASDLVAGELAVDLTNKRLYTEDSGANILELGSNPSTIVVAGTSTLTGNVTASNDVSVGGNLTVTGNATIEGNLTFGNAATDTITLGADVASNILPSADDTYDLGATASRWRDIYIDGTAYLDAINFNGTAITATAAELNILDGVTSTAAELNYLDVTTLGTVEASKAVTADANADVKFGDSDKLVFGAGSDLQIYHDGTNSYISDQGTNDLKVLATDFQLKNAADSEFMMTAVTDGAVTAYHNGSAKLATTSTGIDVTGNVDASLDLLVGGAVSGNAATRTINVGTAGSVSGGVQLWAADTQTHYVQFGDESGTAANHYRGFMAYAHNGDSLRFGTASTERVRIDSSGNVGIGTTSPSNTLTVNSGTTDVVADFISSDANAWIQIKDSSTTDTAVMVGAVGDDMRLRAGSNERVRITSTGNVGIGTASPTGDLEIATSAADTGVDLVLDGNRTSNGGIGSIIFNNNGDSVGMIRSNRASANDAADMLFYTQSAGGSNDERMRIDSSGTLMVGTTDSATYNLTSGGGTALWSNGLISAAKSGAIVGIFNRTSDDGDIVQFRKNGTAVGSIGTESSSLYIGTTETFLKFDDSGDRILPRGANGAQRDAAIGLGSPSNRFTDLYLSDDIISSGASSPALNLTDTTKNCNLIVYAQNSTANVGTYSNHALLFDTNSTERMRIDTSGNLLVGQTSNSETGTGIGLVPDGTSHMYSGSTDTLMLGRGGTDGDILGFNKSGTTVGSIGSEGGDSLYILSGDAGLRFSGGADTILPCTTAGAVRDGGIDLGISSSRFKDLYLSGGVYVGGTGAANKLDDYEEGTFTPTVEGTTTAGSASYSIQQASYTKIGRIVYFNIRVGYSSHTGSGNMIFTGLPFTSANKYSAGNYSFRDGLTVPASEDLIVDVPPSQTYVSLRSIALGTDTSSALALDTDVTDLSINGFYAI